MNDTVYIHRTIEETIAEAAQYFSVISVTGPRQSGKSTLLRHLFANVPCYSMKDVHIREFAETDPVAFLNKHDCMMIDEVQKVPSLLEYIQGIVDNDSQRRFYLTGSSNLELLKGISESLPGRAGVFELLPMSMSETMERSSALSVNELLFQGQYPAICAGKNKAKFFYPSYVKTYLEKDVRDLLNIKSQMQFLRFMRLCAARVGSIFNASELANEVGVDSKTITHWMSVLQASYLVVLLPPYHENITKRLIKSPKLYFTDPGLACYLLDIESDKQLDRDKMRGNIFENLIVMECIKHRLNQGKEANVFFYRDSNGSEVDVLMKQEGMLTALEVKSAMTFSPSFVQHIRHLDSWLTTPIHRRAVVYTGIFENSEGEIQLINYQHLNRLLHQ